MSVFGRKNYVNVLQDGCCFFDGPKLFSSQYWGSVEDNVRMCGFEIIELERPKAGKVRFCARLQGVHESLEETQLDMFEELSFAGLYTRGSRVEECLEAL